MPDAITSTNGVSSRYMSFQPSVLFHPLSHWKEQGVDPTESLDQLEKTRGELKDPWPVAEPLGDMLRELRVFRESAKIAIEANE